MSGAIESYIATHNEIGTAFAWTATAELILAKVDRHYTMKTVDTEVESAVLMPPGTEMNHWRVATMEETPRGGTLKTESGR